MDFIQTFPTVVFPASVTTMPSKRVAASPKKQKGKRKAVDSDPKANEGQNSTKKSRAHAETLEPIQPTPDADNTNTRHSTRSNAGKGGRNSQLEKIGAILDAPVRTRLPKGFTSLGSCVPINPAAPEPPRKARRNHSKVTNSLLPFSTLLSVVCRTPLHHTVQS